MAQGNLSGYQGTSGVIEWIRNGSDVFVKFYNDTGGALANGAIKVLAFKIVSSAITAVVIAPATETTTSNLVGAINNLPYGKATVPDAEWGYLQVQGECEALVDGTADLVAGDQLEVLNAGTALIDAGIATGAVLEAETVAIMKEAYTTNAEALKAVYFVGKYSAIQAA